ncbi:Hypp1788 [Branchiostoma lanceolatum]|uniref:Hypp1788 protein n=1 Tax=Branchiostoma lanceolatum TaxID=7740 RepID=A0A8K0EPT3_BRALA|nr:Hypp1788 [Branchiostoma lanceolatum]
MSYVPPKSQNLSQLRLRYHLTKADPLKKKANMVLLGLLGIFLFTAGSTTASAVPRPDYSQVIAQAACSGVIGAESAYIWAVPRDCSATGDGMTCDQVCQEHQRTLLDQTSSRRPHVFCFDAFQLHFIRTFEMDYTKTYHYQRVQGCSWRANHCGPNYCCCRTPY